MGLFHHNTLSHTRHTPPSPTDQLPSSCTAPFCPIVQWVIDSVGWEENEGCREFHRLDWQLWIRKVSREKAGITRVHLNGLVPKGERARGIVSTHNHNDKEISPSRETLCAAWPFLWWVNLISCECWWRIMQIFGGVEKADSVLGRPLLKHRGIINAKYQAGPSWSP